jgi:uncharacterized protein (TIGR02453 family)
MIAKSTLDFLHNLAANNHKDWFDANRKQYDAAKQNIHDVVAMLLKKMMPIDPTLAHLQVKDCVFRINRDVRFSKDKSPYKTNMGISLSMGGKKLAMAGYYLHIEPNAAFIAGGLYMPMAPELKKIRQEIDYNFNAFEAILKHSSFRQFFSGLVTNSDVMLSRPPKGYEADHPAITYLKLKSFIASAAVSNASLTGKTMIANTVAHFEALQPLIAFLNQGLVEVS